MDTPKSTDAYKAAQGGGQGPQNENQSKPQGGRVVLEQQQIRMLSSGQIL